MEHRPSVFKRGFAMLFERPAAYGLIAIVPYVVAIGLPIVVGRMWVQAHPPAQVGNWDPLSLWRSMDWGEKLLVILAMIATATVPSYVAARGSCRLALEQQRDVDYSLGAVAWDMLRFVPVAVLYFLILGIVTFMGSMILVVPGLLISSACALIIPAGIDGQLGPLASIRRGFSLIGRVYGRVLGVYAGYLAFVVVGRVILTAFLIMAGSSDDAASPSVTAFFILLGIWLLAALLAMALVNIMFTLLYCEARQMDAPPPAAGTAAEQTRG